MFGYVRPYKSEMLVREFEQYKAVYCELCRVLGREYGLLARLSLSYDLTFYALLSLCVNGAALSQHQGRCVVNPLKKCTFIRSEGEDYRRAAGFSLLLMRQKRLDDRADEGFWKRLGCRIVLGLTGRKARKAAGQYPELAALAEAFTRGQALAEAEGQGPDGCAEPTAVLLREAFAGLSCCDGGQRTALGEFGYFLGRWVYLMDAADDLEQDLRRGRFNPLAAKLGLESGRALTEADRDRAAAYCNEALNANVARMILPVNLLELGPFGPIVENVVKKGLPEVQREILFLRVHEKRRGARKL